MHLQTPAPHDSFAPQTARGAQPAARGAAADRRAVREPLDDAGAALLRNPHIGALLESTAVRFPHVVNQLAAVWTEPEVLLAAVDALLLDDRAHRQGFPLATVQELSDLRNYYAAHVAPTLRRLHVSRTHRAGSPAAAPARRPAARRQGGVRRFLWGLVGV